MGGAESDPHRSGEAGIGYTCNATAEAVIELKEDKVNN